MIDKFKCWYRNLTTEGQMTFWVLFPVFTLVIIGVLAWTGFGVEGFLFGIVLFCIVEYWLYKLLEKETKK